MKIIREIEPIKNLSIALGFFDGVHLAHKKVLSDAVKFASKYGYDSAVITFRNHPKCYLSDIIPEYILTRQDRYKYIEEQGVNYLIELDFKDVCNLSSYDYIENFLFKNFSPKFISTGFNHHFGKNGLGNVNLLEKYSTIFNYKYNKVNEILLNNLTVSSSIIRKSLKNGDLTLANDMLGRKFFVRGTVIKGKQLGRQIGFPTANIIYPECIIKIPTGVYFVNVFVKDHQYKAIANFGTCPTVSNKNNYTLESHILDFNEDIYDKEIKVQFISKIRDEIKFKSLEALTNQIKSDIDFVRNM